MRCRLCCGRHPRARVAAACDATSTAGSPGRRGATRCERGRAVAAATARPLSHRVAPRRPGDPAVLVASHAAATRALGWRPQHSLQRIVDDAWAWMQAHPQGYGD
jgi:UDP-glucose 4-epimerase